MRQVVRFRKIVCFASVAFWSLVAAMAEAGDGTRQNIPALSSRETTMRRDPFQDAFDKAGVAQRAKQFERALALFQEASSLADRRSRPMSWLTAMFNICHTLNLQGEQARAAEVARQIVQECEASFGSGDPLTSEALAHLAFVLKQHGNLAAAEPVYRRNVRLLEDKYGEDHFLVANAICRHGSLLQSLGRLDDAEKQLRRALAIAMDSTDATGDPAEMCFYLTHLGFCLHAVQKAEEARLIMDEARKIAAAVDDAALPFAGSILRRQAEYYRDIRELAAAEQAARRGLLRLARRHDVNRAKFFYYDIAAEIYRSVLRAKGLDEARITAAIQRVEQEGAQFQSTAGTEFPRDISAAAGR